MIISLGYRIKSVIATSFRQWATQRLKEYMIKGFTIDDERLKGIVEEITLTPVEKVYLESIKEVSKELKRK